MHVVLFMGPSMNRAESVALMQIAFAHSSLAYLSCLFIFPHSRKKLVNVTEEGKCCTQAEYNNETSRPAVPKREYRTYL